MPDSFNLDPDNAAVGQVPTFLAGNQLTAGDHLVQVRYAMATGASTGSITLTGTGKNFGLTPIAEDYGVVSQSDGVLTLVRLSTWTAVHTLSLKDALSSRRKVSLASPSSGSDGVLYAVGKSGDAGYLFAVRLEANKRLTLAATFAHTGATGASPVVLTPAITGLAENLVLLHVPGLPGDATPQNRLMGLRDDGATFVSHWPAPILLPQVIGVAPTVDEVDRRLYLRMAGENLLHAHDYLTGEKKAQYDIGALSGMGGGFKMNGHLVASQSDGEFTLLLSAYHKAGSRRGTPSPQDGQYVLGFRPKASPSALDWIHKSIRSPTAIRGPGRSGRPSKQPGAIARLSWHREVVSPRFAISRECGG